MKKTSKRRLLFGVLLGAGLLPLCAAQSDQRLDGIWVGAEKLSLAKRTDCPKPDHETLSAKIAVAKGGSLLAVIDGYGQGRYMNLHWSGDTLVFELPNKRRGELRLSPDGKTLIEKGSVRRTTEFGARSGAMGQALIDNGRHEALNDVQASQPSHVTLFTPCVDELTGTFHREK